MQTGGQSFTFRREESLPPLAWLVERREGETRAICGDAVDVTDTTLFEGAWSGRFADSDFRAASTVAGSGVVLEEDSIVLVPPSHTFEVIYCRRSGSDLCASNSLVFLLEHLGEDVREDLHFGRRMHTATHGIHEYERAILRTTGGTIERCMFDNWVIDATGDLRVESKTSTFALEDFAAYRAVMLGELDAIRANARAEGRRRAFSFVVSISSGYDSPVGAVLVSELGCREGLTISGARGGDDDSGEAIGRAIGLEMHVVERSEMVAAQGTPEAEFIATGMGGEDYVHATFEPRLADRIYVTGFLGSNWDTTITPNRAYVRADSSGASFCEFRLRTCFIHVAVPAIGALQLPEIREISNAREMAPWTIQGGYDRPISRRIVETAGVPREAFGQRKKATSILFHQDPGLCSAEFNRQVQQRIRAKGGPGYALACVAYAFRKKAFRALRTTARRSRRLRLGFVSRACEWMAFALIGDHRLFFHDHPRTFHEFMVAGELVGARYRGSRLPE